MLAIVKILYCCTYMLATYYLYTIYMIPLVATYNLFTASHMPYLHASNVLLPIRYLHDSSMQSSLVRLYSLALATVRISNAIHTSYVLATCSSKCIVAISEWLRWIVAFEYILLSGCLCASMRIHATGAEKLISIFISIYLSIYLYIYIYMCVCARVYTAQPSTSPLPSSWSWSCVYAVQGSM